jgi:hypothetical protein
LTIGVWLSVPTSESGYARPARLVDEHDARQVLEVHLVADAGPGRHDPEPAERLLTPLQELVALDVAGELDVDVASERVARGEHVDADRVIDHEIRRDQRTHGSCVPTEHLDRVAHDREIDHCRNAGEVLHQDPRRHERDLAIAAALAGHAASDAMSSLVT